MKFFMRSVLFNSVQFSSVLFLTCPSASLGFKGFVKNSGTMLLNVGLLAVVACGALPPGPGPFPEAGIMPQPVPGAARALTPDGWKVGQTSPAARNCGHAQCFFGCADDSGQTSQSMCAYFDQELTRVLVRASCRMVDCVMSQSRLTMP